MNRWWTKSKSYEEVFIKITFVVSFLSLILVHLIEINNFHFLFETEEIFSAWLFFVLSGMFYYSGYYHENNAILSQKIARFLIESKSKNELKKEIDDLVKQNNFVKYYVELFEKDYKVFKNEFSWILYELSKFDVNFKGKDFFDSFGKINNNEKYIAFLIYLNNVSCMLNSLEYIEFKYNQLNQNKVIQLKNIKENMNSHFKTNGNGFIKFKFEE